MADPEKVSSSLEAISDRYAVFEQDQVLTPQQLNSVTEYLDDQQRLTRVSLLGVGIADGLFASLVKDGIRISRGIGLTTDGDPFQLANDTVFGAFRPYPETAPRYEPFFVDGQRIPLFELLPAASDDETAHPLDQFKTVTSRDPISMIAIAYVETRPKDNDVCSETGCDNQGKEIIVTPRILLTTFPPKPQLIKPPVPPSVQAVPGFGLIDVTRPILTSDITSADRLVELYRKSCEPAVASIKAALETLRGRFPVPAIDSARLSTLATDFLTTVSRAQWFYDLLKDLADTCNEVRALLADKTVSCPLVDAFPKHLTLGKVDSVAFRTAFYPSPMVGNGAEKRAHLVFLVRRLGLMINAFGAPAGDVRIVPSYREDRPLEHRTMPAYYDVARLSAAAWSREPQEERTLTRQLGRYDFFRVAGHQGIPVDRAVEQVEAIIRANNLPIAVCPVLLAGGSKRPRWKLPAAVEDLRNLRYVLGRDLRSQLSDVAAQATALKPEDKFGDVGALLSEAGTSAVRAFDQLSVTLESQPSDFSWKEDAGRVVDRVVKFKGAVGATLQTDHPTAFETLLTSTHVDWLPVVDELIHWKEDDPNNGLTFASLWKDHPGLEHLGGVTPGGTLVLLYDENDNVLGDLMLPYRCAAPEKDVVANPPTLPPVPVPNPRPVFPPLPVRPPSFPPLLPPIPVPPKPGDPRPWPRIRPELPPGGLRRIVPTEEQITVRIKSDVIPQIERVRSEIKQDVDSAIPRLEAVRADYIGAFRDSIQILGQKAISPVAKLPLSDRVVDLMKRELDLKVERKAALLEAIVAKPDDPVLKQEREKLDAELSGSAIAIVEQLSKSTLTFTPGSDGARALSEVAISIRDLSPEAKKQVGDRFSQVSASNAALKPVVANLVAVHGLR